MVSVNLTTTFQRLALCQISLTSLLLQSRLPEKINLWVSREPFLRDAGITDSGSIDQLMNSLPYAGRDRVCIHWVENIGPYRKLIPILRQSGADELIITADDDIFYGRNWLAGLLNAFEAGGGKPVAGRVRAIKKNILGKRMSYLHWQLITDPAVIDENFVITFGGGAVLTKSMFRKDDISDDSFLDIASTADDIWYSRLLIRSNNQVVVVPSLINELYFINHSDGLVNYNYPKVFSVMHKIRLHLWDKFLGFLGWSVCGNDIAFDRVDRYFEDD